MFGLADMRQLQCIFLKYVDIFEVNAASWTAEGRVQVSRITSRMGSNPHGRLSSNPFSNFEVNDGCGRAEWAISEPKAAAPAIPRREGAISRHGSLRDTLGKQQRWLAQHKQFVESNRKLHEVATLSEHFPGISPYPRVNERGKRPRCGSEECWGSSLCSWSPCHQRTRAPTSCSFESKTRTGRLQLSSVSAVWPFYIQNSGLSYVINTGRGPFITLCDRLADKRHRSNTQSCNNQAGDYREIGMFCYINVSCVSYL